MFSQFVGAIKIYNLGLVKNYATWLSAHKSSYWDYFDKAIKVTGSIECIIVILRIILSFHLHRFEKVLKFWKHLHLQEHLYIIC